MNRSSRALWRSPLLFLSGGALIIACDRPPASLADCKDPACMQAWVEARWELDEEETLQAVRALPETLERTLLVQVIVEDHPDKTSALCDLLPEGPTRLRCETLEERPHLWQVDDADPTAGVMGAGQVYSTLQTDLSDLQLPWNAEDAVEAPCGKGQVRNTCQTRHALQLAQAGRLRDAAHACMGSDSEKWKNECFFQAAESAWDPKATVAAGRSATLCMGAGYYVYRCLGHLAGRVAREAPPASQEAPEQWMQVMRNAKDVYDSLYRYDQELAELWISQLWADAMVVSYEAVKEPSGLPLSYIGVRPTTQVRAAIAWRLWALEGTEPRSLKDWADRVELAMYERKVDPDVPAGVEREARPRDGWREDLPGEEQIPWIPWQLNDRRAVLQDPVLDAMICVLEAAAREGQGQRARLFVEGLKHDDPTVRWTAARLMGNFMKRSRIEVDPEQEQEPLVRARLERMGRATVED